MKEQKFLDVIALAVNVIIIWILDSEVIIIWILNSEGQKFLDVIALAVNVIIIWISDSEGTKVFGCKARTFLFTPAQSCFSTMMILLILMK